MNEKNGTDSGNESEFPDTYYLSVSDRVIVNAAIQLLDKIAHAHLPAQPNWSRWPKPFMS